MLKTYVVGSTVSDSLGTPPTTSDISVLGQRLAWARNVKLISGTNYNFSLTIPSGADYDLYLYNMTGDTWGQPVIVAKSTTAATGGFENITYTPALSGEYYVVVKRASEATNAGQFTLTSWPKQTVQTDHLLLIAQPNQLPYARMQAVTLKVDVLNQQNPDLNSILSLTITGPNSYYYFDFQSVNVTADTVGEYSFAWNMPNVVGTYVVEVGLMPAQLTAYDVIVLKAV